MKRVAIDALRVLQDRFGICLIAYVIMPDHLHLIFYPHRKGDDVPIPFSKILHAFKKHLGYHGKQAMLRLSKRTGQLWSEPLNDWLAGKMQKQTIMETRGYDFNIDRHETLLEKIDYCHKNPVTRGLVERATDWPWSSYRFYECDDSSVLKMDWDGAWPIIW